MADSIIEMATKLGKAISESPQAAKLREVRKELDEHKDVLDTLSQYQQQAQKVEQLEHENKPVEVDDKHKLRDLHDKLVANDLFKRFTAAQVEYVDLMRQVNQTLRKQLAEVEK
jgi:cell fate (sporulation/competence/biofilm development) regulator YlbF (YheA/YmcA/DUF963 family)